tara:strand:+ start:248 stop:1924 length:1677 start_codon:yes stop_codon:yes gene_type:complete
MLAIYTRLSKQDEDSNSIDNQLREGKAFAKDNNYTNYKIYNEGEGVSGTLNIAERPKLNELLYDIEQGNVKSVWMRNQNRLDRDSLTFFIFADATKKNDVNVYFGSSEKMDFNDPTTLLQSSILSNLNAYQAQLQGMQTKKSLGDSAKLGQVWGVIPYGYSRSKEKKPIVNDDEAEVIREIFNLSLSGWGVKRIGTYLNKKGVPTRMNKLDGKLKIRNKFDGSLTLRDYKDIPWSDRTVLGILRNKWYIGERTYQKIKYTNIPPIINRDMFDEVQIRLDNRVNGGGKKVEYRYLLKGLLRCHKCGRNYYGRKRSNGKDNFYMCSSKRYPTKNCGSSGINITMLESFIVKHLFTSKDLLNHLREIESTDNSLNELIKELEQLHNQLDSENKTVQHLANLIANPDLTNDEIFIGKYNTAKTNVKTIQGRIKSVQKLIDERSNSKRLKEYENERNNVDLSNFTALKTSIKQIIKKIDIQTSTDKKGKVIYTVSISYNGYDEVSTFTTSQPYQEWLYILKASRDIPDKKVGWGIYLNSTRISPVDGGGLKPIIVDGDLIEFN